MSWKGRFAVLTVTACVAHLLATPATPAAKPAPKLQAKTAARGASS